MRFTIGRSLAVLIVMLASAALGAWFKPTDVAADVGPRVDLEAMVPQAFAGWTIDPEEIPIHQPPELQAVVDRTYDQVLERTYVDGQGRRVMLSIDYSRRSEKGIQTHRPEICYPAQGFAIERISAPVRLQTVAGEIDATRLVARRGSRNEPITYWVIVGEEQARFGMQMRWLQFRSGLTGAIPDGLLIRVSTISFDAEAAFALQSNFVKDLVVSVAPIDRPHFLGTPFRRRALSPQADVGLLLKLE